MIIASVFLVSPIIKSSKSKRTTSSNHIPPSSDTANGKSSTSKVLDESHPRPTSASSSSTSSRRSSSNNHPNKSSTSRSKPTHNSTSTKTSTTTPTPNTDSTMLDPLAFAAAASGGLGYPYFLPSLLSQASSTNNNPSTNSAATYPFSNLSSSLLNPAATLYPFLSPDWLTSSSKFLDGYANLTSDKSLGKFQLIRFLLDHTSFSPSSPRFQRISFTCHSKEKYFPFIGILSS